MIEPSDLPGPSEDDVQKVVTEGLHSLGMLVWVISRRRKKCWNCGRWPKGGDGVSKGACDVYCRRPTWPKAMVLVLEIKRPGPIKWSSVEQRLASEAGDTWICQSWEDAVAAVRSIDDALEGEQDDGK